jgi:hypothetical protein
MQPITAAALDHILAFLAPLFLNGADGDAQAARVAAAATLHAYAARDEQELRLAAQVIAFSLRALDALARAAEPDLDIKAILRLNGSAASLHRAAMRCQKEFDRLRAQPLVQIEEERNALERESTLGINDRRAFAVPGQVETALMQHPEAALAASSPELLACTAAAPHLAAAPSGPEPVPPAAAPEAPSAARPLAPPLSRQQRRLAERLAERERRRQQDRSRQVERTLLSA